MSSTIMQPIDNEKQRWWTPQAVATAAALGILVACYTYGMFKTMPWFMALIFLIPITGIAVLAVYMNMCLVNGSCNALAWVFVAFYIISAIITIFTTVFVSSNERLLRAAYNMR